MSDFDRPTSTLYERPSRRRPAGGRPTGSRLGDRIARTITGIDRSRPELADWEADGELEYAVEDRTQPIWDQTDERYPRARNGYDPDAVERHVAELERELAELRTNRNPSEAVAVEIEKIGEQTSSILLLAHDQAQKLKREAQDQADRCLADAAANAVKMTEDAKRKLGELDTETDSVWQERSRLLQDARGVAGALLTLVDEAAERFPSEAEKSATGSHPKPIAAAEVATAEISAVLDEPEDPQE
jgi:hypothetical protein